MRTGRDGYLAAIVAAESSDPLIPDALKVRIMRGLFFVHLYGAFEYSIDQTFIRLAQHISSRSVSHRHLNRPIFSVALDPQFMALQDTSDWSKKYKKRYDTIETMDASSTASIRDTVLSPGMQSINAATVSTAFTAYGISDRPFVDLPTRSYLDEVVEKRHAVAHGRAVTVGNVKSKELRKRYGSLQAQTTYVIDKVSDFMGAKRFVVARHRAKY